ncbi:MAG: quinoprotein dehydrogenase-associated SoxYZ-like carrier [Proteobacteria bacterium]|nr:quinoprotein dehydrogenase-associated SoxYZ-like carrier [Pseudomonadota bacterium]
MKPFSKLIAALSMCLTMSANGQSSPIDIWETLLRPAYFAATELIESGNVISLKTPYRAEDATVTPLSITASFAQSSARSIDKIYVFVEQNPQPLAGIFHLSAEMGRADLAMRVRVDKYSNVRVVAVLNNGEHHLVTNFVKAQGGCSAPLAADFAQAMQSIGKMKFRLLGDKQADNTILAQFMLSHPNITGMQKDQKTQLIRPAHYVETVKIYFNNENILTANTGFSISSDPSLRFFFKPQGGGEIRAEVVDSKGNEWQQTFMVES